MRHRIILTAAVVAVPFLAAAVSAQSAPPMTRAQIDPARLPDDKARAAAGNAPKRRMPGI